MTDDIDQLSNYVNEVFINECAHVIKNPAIYIAGFEHYINSATN